MIDIHQLLFSYTSDKPASNNQSTLLNIPQWHLKSGEHLFLQGPSGCGKSTFLNILSGRLRPSSGHITVLGQRLDQLSNRQLDRFRAEHMGVIYQQFNLIPYLSPLENLSAAQYFARSSSLFSRRGKLNAADNITCEDDIEPVSLSERAEPLLNALALPSSRWHSPVAQLSIGQQQRVAIARALIHSPKLLIADEPTSALDHIQRDNFLALLLENCSQTGATIVFVSHDNGLASHFDRHQNFSEFNHHAAV